MNSHPKTLARLGLLAAATLLLAGLSGRADATATMDTSTRTGASTGNSVGGRDLTAGTITYVLNHNVWVANTDGSNARQVTTGGTKSSPWYSPTESDSGQIVAGRGNLIYRMDQWGTLLNTIDPPNLLSGGGDVIGGKMSSIAVSPNGALIAYAYSKEYCSRSDNRCRNWPVTGFTSSKRLSDWRDYGSSYGETPAWLSNTRVSLDERGPFDNLYLYEPGRGRVSSYWFDDANIHTDDLDLFDLQASLGSSYGVAVRGTFDQARIAFYDLSTSGNFRTGVPTPAVTQIAETSPVLGINSPTIAADGSLAAWREPDGIWTFAMAAGVQPQLTIRGGSWPSLSRASLQTTRRTYSFTASSAANLAGAARVGARLRAVRPVLQVPPTSVRYQWFRDNRAIGAAKGSTYKVSVKDRGHRLSVRITVARQGYFTKTFTSKALQIKR